MAQILRRGFLLGSGTLAFAGPLSSPSSAQAARPPNSFCSVLDFGAVGDGKRMNTRAFLAAIESCAKAGGGMVYVPEGKYLTGAIKLQSNVNLHLSSGATILGSKDPTDYPVYPSPWPDGTRMISSLIYGERLANITLSGRGVVDGQGRAWWLREWLARPRRHVPVPSMSSEERRDEISKIRYGRPRLIHLANCRNVLIEGLTLTHSAFWTVHPIFCEDITISGVTILNPVPSPNTDGIDPESCRNLHISNCHIDVGDDCIAIKAGKDAVGRQVGKPCENITITNLTTARGHGGVSIGSEMSGGVRNVSISNCVFQGTDRGIRIKTQRGRGGAVEGVTANNIVMQDVPEAFDITMFYSRGDVESSEPVGDGTPRFRNFHMANISARGARSAGQITGLREMPVSGVSFNGVWLDAARGFVCQNARQIEFHNVRIDSARGPALTARNVEGLELDGISTAQTSGDIPIVDLEDVRDVFVRGCSAPRRASVFMQVGGAQSSGVVLRANNMAREAKPVVFVRGAMPGILSQE